MRIVWNKKQLITIFMSLVLINGPVIADTLIHAGRVIDGVATQSVNDRTIRVVGNTITGIELSLIHI